MKIELIDGNGEVLEDFTTRKLVLDMFAESSEPKAAYLREANDEHPPDTAEIRVNLDKDCPYV